MVEEGFSRPDFFGVMDRLRRTLGFPGLSSKELSKVRPLQDYGLAFERLLVHGLGRTGLEAQAWTQTTESSRRPQTSLGLLPRTLAEGLWSGTGGLRAAGRGSSGAARCRAVCGTLARTETIEALQHLLVRVGWVLTDVTGSLAKWKR